MVGRACFAKGYAKVRMGCVCRGVSWGSKEVMGKWCEKRGVVFVGIIGLKIVDFFGLGWYIYVYKLLFPGSSTVERLAVNEKVLGSNPSRGATHHSVHGKAINRMSKWGCTK